jgi:hypothetical protein
MIISMHKQLQILAHVLRLLLIANLHIKPINVQKVSDILVPQILQYGSLTIFHFETKVKV